MQFSTKEWFEYREKAMKVGMKLDQLKKQHGGKIKMEDEATHHYIEEITVILRKCSSYMDKCSLGMRNTLWDYNSRDETTHISSPEFAYKHLLHLL